MARGNSENILHFGLVRLRVVGQGNLELFLRSLDNVRSVQLADLSLQATNNIEPTRLSNFTEQRAQLEGKTVNIGENFNISKIIIFVRPVGTSYPQ